MITIKGSDSNRVIKEINIQAIVRITSNELTFLRANQKAHEVQSDLEAVIEKYFEGCDWAGSNSPEWVY